MAIVEAILTICLSTRFELITQHVIEFNQLAIANAEGSENILNRVMTKDNIGLCALLETTEGIWERDRSECISSTRH